MACIRDAEFFGFMEREAANLARFEPLAMRSVIHRSAALHLNHIATSGDPFEFGSARPLDFGHWSAHKLEPLSDYRIRHGEAVAIGLALDVIYSRNAGWLDVDSAGRILRLLETLGFSLYANELHYAGSGHELVLLQGLKLVSTWAASSTITLLKGIGHGFEVHKVERKWVVAALEELRERQRTRRERAP